MTTFKIIMIIFIIINFVCGVTNVYLKQCLYAISCFIVTTVGVIIILTVHI